MFIFSTTFDMRGIVKFSRDVEGLKVFVGKTLFERKVKSDVFHNDLR